MSPLKMILVGTFVIQSSMAFAEDNRLEASVLFLTQPMRLSQISDGYEDVSSGSGADFSYLRRKSPYFSIGGGTFGLSGEKGDTSMDINGGGLILETYYGAPFVFSARLFLGGAGGQIIGKQSDTSEKSVDEGIFTHVGGFLAAPQLSVGYAFEPIQLNLFVRRYQFASGEGKIEKLSSTYAGLGIVSLF